MITLQPKRKVLWEVTPSLGPSTTEGLHYSTDDMIQKWKSIFSVKKGQSLGWSSVGRIQIPARCDEPMYPETVTLQNASSSTERTVEETTLATRSTNPARSSGERTTNSSHRLVHEADDIANNKWFPSAESSIERYVTEITAGMIRMADRVWKHVPCVDKTSEDSLSISTRMVLV